MGDRLGKVRGRQVGKVMGDRLGKVRDGRQVR